MLECTYFTKEPVSSQRTLVKTSTQNGIIMTHSKSTSACSPIAKSDQNNQHQQELRVNFGWKEIEPGKQSLPYVKRGLECLVAVLIFKNYLLMDMAKIFSIHILSCIRWRRYYMSESEADTFNEINYEHCNGNLVVKHTFKKGEWMMSLVDVTRIMYFFKTCHAALFLRKFENNLFGFIRIANETDVPFIWDNGRQLVPLFYFDGQSEYLDSNSTFLTDPWKLGYLEFCCKVQKIREMYYANPNIRVVDIEYVKKLFPTDVTFELSWPDKLNQDLLAAGVQLSTLNKALWNVIMEDATNQVATRSGVEASQRSPTEKPYVQPAVNNWHIMDSTSSKLPRLEEQINQISGSNANDAPVNVESTPKTASSLSVYRTDVATKQCFQIEVSDLIKHISETDRRTKKMKTTQRTKNQRNRGAVNKKVLDLKSTQVAQHNNCKGVTSVSINPQHYVQHRSDFNPAPNVSGNSPKIVSTTWTPSPCCPLFYHNQTDNVASAHMCLQCGRKENNYTIFQLPSCMNFSVTQSSNRHWHSPDIYSAAPEQSRLVELRPALKQLILRYANVTTKENNTLDQETLARYFFAGQKATPSVNEIHEVLKEIQRFCNDPQSWLLENDVSHTSAQSNQPATLNSTNTIQRVYRTDASASNRYNNDCNEKYLAGMEPKIQVVEHLDLDWPLDKPIYSLKQLVIKGCYFLGLQLSPVMDEFLVNFHKFATCFLPPNSSSLMYGHLLDQFKCIYYLNEQQKAIWREVVKSGAVKDFGCVFVLHSEIVLNLVN